MLKKIINIVLILCTITSCAQKNISDKEMETIIKTAYEQTPKHEKQPMYAIQVDKKGCRASLWVNDFNVDDYWYKGGYTITETISSFIIKSGKQTITLKVYPRDGAEYIDDRAFVALELIYVPQKGCDMDKYQLLQTIKLPEGLAEKKLPYFEMTIPFEAKVPWDHSAFYNNLQDLRDIPNITQKILAEYKKYLVIIENNQQQVYIEKKFKNKKYEFEANYVNEEDINEYMKSYLKQTSPLKNKEVIFLDTEYEIVYELDGRIASLVSKSDREGIIRIYYGDVITEGEHEGKKQSELTIGFKLVLPKNKTELESL
ncbi:hypothetical protein B0A58_02760 [Flavobacterium branchiophilum NBRC 15030 = ATCC 35035]|uniref:Lipoprotein n=1 Tax=Flavobacterium branchiophilum TaxID=55197 RepID=A0A2H3KA17_9FLAO|nr:hypothetical protein [Flavobacterium branchiophilum]OXA80100.1 hypothetical protein B0A58_02760 [Flavobacterium branchiophilum NBRC 15030 = ATCC 35035]PDS23305.1 hypothetical protein B0A77_11255 [Flavobacterium branchiophilum]TQM40164.1 hypothetical protein BC670_1034 [Flavobacterium branchiophilum]GEM54941.1 hypothetical protein FB1_11620 [Flavobacterium branchiophilum NBRC 15030 = ATCC 35035]